MFFCPFLFLHKFNLHKLATSADAWHPRQMPQRPVHQDQPHTHEDFYYFCFLFYSWFFLSFLNITLLNFSKKKILLYCKGTGHMSTNLISPGPAAISLPSFGPFLALFYTQKCRPMRLCKRSSAWNFNTLWWHVVFLFGTSIETK